MRPVHKHLIFRGELHDPPVSTRVLNHWLKKLVSALDMEITKGPFSFYLEDEGNRGLTGAVLIKTSHIAVHVWDEERPALMQLDVYSCRDFQPVTVLNSLERFTPCGWTWAFIDREHAIDVLKLRCQPDTRQHIRLGGVDVTEHLLGGPEALE